VLPTLAEAAPDVSLLELLQNSNVESGLQTAVLNRRGATTRALDEGGVQEKELVEKYRRMAEQVADGSPRTAVIMRSLATSYEADARREERSAERFRRGLEH
jgi:phosphate-selective porin